MRRAGVRAMESEVLGSGGVGTGGAGANAGARLDDAAGEGAIGVVVAGRGGECGLELQLGLDVDGAKGA